MIIKNMFSKPIDRDIKGVIKVGQDDDANIKQELEEYVVTRELQKHFSDFFASYKRGIIGNTDKMGVWISGFFGSGKSHFLKILSYLLKNSTVEGKRAIEYFTGRESDASIRPKIEDPMLIAEMTKAGTIPYLAEFEHQLDNEDRFKEFKEKFEAKAGEPWGKKRQAFAVIQDKADFADGYPFIPD